MHLPARLPAPLLFMAATAFATLSATAQLQLTAAPQQAVVFDGSTDANSVLLVAFSDQGYLRDGHKHPGFCEYELPEGIVATTGPEAGLTTVEDVPAMKGYEVAPVGPGPLPEPLEDDCEVLAAFRNVDAWIKSVCSTAEVLLENAWNCFEDHRDTRCQIIVAAQNARLLPGDDPVAWSAWIAPTPENPGISFVVPCERALRKLYGLRSQLDALFYWVAQCHAVGLPATLQQTLGKIVNQGGLTQPEKHALAYQAYDQMDQAGYFVEKAQHAFDKIQRFKDDLTFEAIQAACDECNGAGRAAKAASAGNDSEQNQKGPSIKERLLRDFTQALRGEADRADAQRLRALIRRLEGTPDGRIFHVAYPSVSPVSEFHVALSPQCATGDRQGPLVVVLEALNSQARLPEMTVEDEAGLLQAFGAFARTLKPYPPTPIRVR